MIAQSRRAVTLLELLIVIAIIGVLVGLLLSAVQTVRASAARLACANNLKQIGLAAQHYESVQQHLPASMELIASISGRQKTPWGWTLTLLPFLEYEPLYTQARIAYQAEWRSDLNPPHRGLSTVVKVYVCPVDGRLIQPITDDLGLTAAYGSYWGIASSALHFEPFPDGGGRAVDPADGAMLPYTPVRLTDITDGTSSTLCIGEMIPLGRYLAGNWYSPGKIATLPGGGGIWSAAMYSERPDTYCAGPVRYGPSRVNNPCDTGHFGSLHTGGSNFVLCDGSVRFIPYSAEPIMPALASRAGGEVVEVP
jgi:prepilin-type N-terminal cleavage/methylation domain-containing protein/prepilin-type processing-associated H-X9-DG protein